MTVSEQVIQILDALCTRFGIVIDWTASNIIPYVEELIVRFITFEINTSIFWIVLWGSIMLISWIVTIPFICKAKKLEWNYQNYYITWTAMWMIMISCLFSLIAIVVAGVQVYDIMEAKLIPEKTLYDYISYQLSLI